MSRARTPFRQTDISRAIKAVEKAGKSVARVEVDHNGRIVVICGEPEEVARTGTVDLVAIARGEDGPKGKRARGG